MSACAQAGGLDDGQSTERAEAWRARGRTGRAVPPPLLERLALELLGVLLFVVLVLLGFLSVPAEHVELQAQQPTELRFDRADLERAQQHEYVHKLWLLHLARRLRRDRPRDVGWAFGQLSPAC